MQLLFGGHQYEDLLERALGDGALRDAKQLPRIGQHPEQGRQGSATLRHRECHGRRLQLLEPRGTALLDVRLQPRRLVHRVRRQAEVELEALPVAGLERLYWPYAAENPVHHHADAAAQRFALLHRVGREDRATLARAPPDRRPEEALGRGVHPRGRFVEQHERRPADERDADAQLALVATRVGASWLVGVFGQIKQLEQILHIGFDDGVGHRLDARIKAKCLAARHQRLERVVLRAVADARAYAGLLPPDGHTVECGVSGGGHHGAGEHVERGRLSGAVCAEEAEALTLTDAQGHVTHGHLDAVHFMQVGEDELLMGVPGVDGSALSAHRLVLKAAAGEALPHGRYDARVDRLSVGLGCGGGLAEQLPAAVEKHLRDRSGLVVLKQQCDCPKKDTLADERHEWRAELV
mmetsp:Transcript_6935/g.22726  ORF Transcript_6935/g.22726 Transcript_6935/m.22726 type:complete len:409 (+) Transcript_6935:333-1559(+)